MQYKFFYGNSDVNAKRSHDVGGISRFLVFDIETIPDDGMIEEAGKPRDKAILRSLRGEPGEKVEGFLAPPYHRIVSLALMGIFADKENGPRIVAKSVYGSEPSIVDSFWRAFGAMLGLRGRKDDDDEVVEFIVEDYPCFVTFNGKNFDMPVIIARSLKYAVNLEAILKAAMSYYFDTYDKWENQVPNYQNQYSKYHIDLCTGLLGGRNSLSLAAACHLAGIPVKTDLSGDKVMDAYNRGEHKSIARYCAEDVLATARLFAVYNTHFLFKRYPFPSVKKLQNIEFELVALDK